MATSSKHTELRILIVEDQEITRMGLKMVLEQNAGLQVVGEADNGEAAVRMAMELNPQVILMDVGLPIMDGIEATCRIKADAPHIKVLMLTSHDHSEDVIAALSAGADGYALKETKVDVIISALQVIMSDAVWLDAKIARTLVGCMQVDSKKKKALGKDDKFGLSPRELEILQLLMEGLSNQEMADRLFISAETVKTHMRHIMEKLMVADRTQAAVKALREGIVCEHAVG